MQLAGVRVRDGAVLEDSRHLRVDDPDLATKLDENYSRGTKVLALTIPERSTILAALENAPAELAELRGVLLRELPDVDPRDSPSGRRRRKASPHTCVWTPRRRGIPCKLWLGGGMPGNLVEPPRNTRSFSP